MASNNTENRNEFDKIKDINSFIKNNVNTLNNNVKSLKGRLTKLSEELTTRRSELKAALKASESAETEVVAPVETKVEPKDVEATPVETPVVEETKVEPTPVVEAKVETPATPVEHKSETRFVKVEDRRRDTNREPRGDASYHNRDNNRDSRDGNRAPRGTFGNRNGQQGSYEPRGDRRQGGQFGDRPFNRNTGDRNDRPMNGGRGTRDFARTNNSTAKSAPMPTYQVPKDTSKKKHPADKPNMSPRTEERSKLNKKSLIKKGYVNDFDLDTELNGGAIRHHKLKKTKKQEFIQPVAVIDHAVVNSDIIPIKTLAEKLGKPAVELVKKLFELGQMATVNSSVDFETAELIASEYDITLELQMAQTAEDKLKDIISASNEANMVKRPPIVTIMGHVDHGKTSLLDYIRKSHVTSGEAGGITQHIGAYTIKVNGEKITFLDTPGHEAFITMRKRGADVTDIAVIVVAADDGIMPQTQEAISHAKAAGVSIIVAINKIDKPEANIDRIKTQLTNYDLVPEEWGGDVIVCPVSAKTGEGVQELLENIILLAEVKELKADPTIPAQGSIIEARLDKGTGPVATVLVQNGTLHVHDFVVAGTSIGKVRAMVDEKNQRLKEAGPSVAVSVLGFSDVPSAGDQLVVVKDEKLAKEVAADRAKEERESMQKIASKKNLEDMFKDMAEGEKKILPIIIKGDVQGSVEAVRESLEKLSEDMSEEGVKITFPLCAVGAVNASDTMLAETTGAIIIAFNVRPDAKAREYAEQNKIDIKYFRIIYDLIETIEKAMHGMLEPTFEENIIGHAEVREVFNITGVGTIAGSYVTDGKVMRNAKIRFLRDNIVIYEGSISSLKRMKDDVKEVASGYECGIGLEGISDIKIGDTMEAFIMEKVEK